MMIEMRHIFFKYDKAKIETLKDISFFLEKGKVLAVVGPSGGGKSTLLRVIAGLEKPLKGELVIDGKTMISKLVFINPERRGVGMVFQDYALFPHMTVQRNIEFGISNLPKTERENRVRELLSLVNLPNYSKRYPHELSGGQQQRIALARALAPKPKVLLLDEPFSNLDTHLLEKVRGELFRIIKETGITTIIVTHNPDDAKILADRIISIVDGKVESISDNG